jgi:hypothetical protein
VNRRSHAGRIHIADRGRRPAECMVLHLPERRKGGVHGRRCNSLTHHPGPLTVHFTQHPSDAHPRVVSPPISERAAASAASRMIPLPTLDASYSQGCAAHQLGQFICHEGPFGAHDHAHVVDQQHSWQPTDLHSGGCMVWGKHNDRYAACGRCIMAAAHGWKRDTHMGCGRCSNEIG